MFVDLHTHTTASDGTHAPSVNVEKARQKGLAAVAITDHDTVAGIPEAMERGKAIGIEVIPGVEISSVHEGRDIHVLGYFMDIEDEAFLRMLERQKNARQRRNERLLDRLNDLGYPIAMEEVRARKKGRSGNIGRPHIAEVMMEKGWVRTMEEAFARFLGPSGAAYVNTPRISPFQAIDEIKRAGGAAVLAHPGLYDHDALVEELIRYGLNGVEADHPDHDEEQAKRYREWAKRSGLIATAGSDYHGERNGIVFHAELGAKKAPYAVVEQLKEVCH